VAAFYSLRLAFAPLLETIFLLDRWLFLAERLREEDKVLLAPVFEPDLSPRNIALLAIKT